MAQSDPAEIPQEIIDQVIDLSSEDKTTLKACSLISRAWVYRTRKHLFSTLKLTSDSLVTWCEVIAAPTPETEHPVPRTTSRPPASSSYGSSWLSSYVISLKLIPAYSPVHIKAALLRVNAHLSAFINLKTLTLYAIRIHSFEEASLRACFGPFAKTVRELKIWMCSLGWNFLAFLKVFTHLESLELDGSLWARNNFAGPPRVLPEDLPKLRGSFSVSGSANTDTRFLNLLGLLANARLEYHTITIAYDTTSTFPGLNALFAKCKDHLRMLNFTKVVDVD